MFEEEAEEIAKDIYIHHFDDDVSYPEVLKAITVGVQKGAEFGCNKANEWHNLKTEKPPLRKEVLWCVDKQLWLGGLEENRIDFGEWELDSVLFNDYEIYWKEIVLPEEVKEND